MGYFDAFFRVMVATMRSLMLMLSLVVVTQYMIEHPVPKDRGAESMAPLALAAVVLIAREGLRWDR